VHDAMHDIVVNPYGRKDGGRRGLMLRGPWDSSCADLIKREKLTAVYLNVAKGWTGEDCSFLRSVPDIEEVGIIASQVAGLEALESLNKLKELEITCSTTSVVDFTKLPSLERVYVYWWPGALSLFQCTSLRRVHLDKVKQFPDGFAQHWLALKELTLSNMSLSNLNELKPLTTLEKLELHNLRGLEDFSVLASMKSLRWLSIRGCKGLTALDSVQGLDQLEVLLLDDGGMIETLRPLKSLAALKALSFTGTTSVADGDLSVLVTLPRLAMLGFAPKRHYTHRLVKKWAWSNFDVPDRLLEAA
jgi:hypothetical protein